MLTKAKILALLNIIAQLQKTEVDDETQIASLKAQISEIQKNDAELQDPDLVAAVDAIVGNASTTPPPSE